MGYLVVGVDGSKPSKPALRYALELAEDRKLTLRAVMVYEPPTDGPYLGSLATAPDAATLERMSADEHRWREHTHGVARERTQEHLDRLLHEAGADRSSAAVECLVVADERPARALLRLAERADGLVVGSRGRGGFSGLLLGSVSQQVVQHAPCPVTVVPYRAG